MNWSLVVLGLATIAFFGCTALTQQPQAMQQCVCDPYNCTCPCMTSGVNQFCPVVSYGYEGIIFKLMVNDTLYYSDFDTPTGPVQTGTAAWCISTPNIGVCYRVLTYAFHEYISAGNFTLDIITDQTDFMTQDFNFRMKQAPEVSESYLRDQTELPKELSPVLDNCTSQCPAKGGCSCLSSAFTNCYCCPSAATEVDVCVALSMKRLNDEDILFYSFLEYKGFKWAYGSAVFYPYDIINLSREYCSSGYYIDGVTPCLVVEETSNSTFPFAGTLQFKEGPGETAVEIGRFSF